MAQNGFKIFDSDTHVGPYVDVLERYMAGAEKARLGEWEAYKSASNAGYTIYSRGQRHYRRRLGAADPQDTRGKYMAGFTGAHGARKPHPRVDHDPAERINDMDFEGVDVNLTLPSGWFGTWTSADDVPLEQAMYRAYHRWMEDYCSAFPDRLGGVILCCGRDVEGALAEIRRWGKSRWAWGAMLYAPHGVPIDHPAFEPIWSACQDFDLAVALHTFTVMPPYAPGGLDTWDNLFLQRSAAHPWCGMRNMAALIGAGVMDRYPRLRIGTLEAGHGWLPFWMARLNEHAKTIRSALPQLQSAPGDYVTSGRYFQSIEAPEGAKLTNAVIDLVGEDVLMYASDYPHGESHFPHTVEMVMGWDMPEARKRKLFWDNAKRYYTRCGFA
ncbi:MAG TPA: amidohydrolase family protein [Burkholderiales bacterium]|nr:amidohydrolase family protein [Burkholderiales bacterium]